MAASLAVSIVFSGRGWEDRLPEVTEIDPWGIRAAVCRATDVSSLRRASPIRRRWAKSYLDFTFIGEAG
jgi:hypothetical protein